MRIDREDEEKQENQPGRNVGSDKDGSRNKQKGLPLWNTEMAFVQSSHYRGFRKYPGWPVFRNSRQCYRVPFSLVFHSAVFLPGHRAARWHKLGPPQQVSMREGRHMAIKQVSPLTQVVSADCWLSCAWYCLGVRFHQGPLCQCHVYKETGEAFICSGTNHPAVV